MQPRLTDPKITDLGAHLPMSRKIPEGLAATPALPTDPHPPWQSLVYPVPPLRRRCSGRGGVRCVGA